MMNGHAIARMMIEDPIRCCGLQIAAPDWRYVGKGKFGDDFVFVSNTLCRVVTIGEWPTYLGVVYTSCVVPGLNELDNQTILGIITSSPSGGTRNQELLEITENI